MTAQLLLQAAEAARAGEYQEALSLYRSVTDQDPNNSDGWLGQARVLWALNSLSEAEDAYMTAIQTDPQLVQGWIELIYLEVGAGAVEAAADNLRTALEYHPDHPDLLRCKEEVEKPPTSDTFEGALYNLRCAIFADRIDDALRELDQIEATFGQDPRSALARAEVFIATGEGELPPLIHTLTREFRRLPDDWELQSVLGRLYLRRSPMRNPRMGVGLCEEAWRRSRQAPRAGLALAEAWSFVGKKALALALCRKIADGDGLEAEVAESWLEELGDEPEEQGP